MPKLPANPCADSHPELKLLIEITALNERLPRFLCNRCGDHLGFEEAIRNDERLKLAERHRAAAETAAERPTGAGEGDGMAEAATGDLDGEA